MSSIANEAARLIDILPDADKAFAYEFIKKLVLAWDPDITKVTAEEAKRIKEAEKMLRSFDWDGLEAWITETHI